MLFFAFKCETLQVNANENTEKEFNNFLKKYDLHNVIVEEGISIINNITNLRVYALNNYTKVNSANVNSIKQQFEKIYNSGIQNIDKYLQILQKYQDPENPYRQKDIEMANSIKELYEDYYTTFLDFIDALVAGDVERANKIDEGLIKIGDELFKNIYLAPADAFNTLGVDMIAVFNAVSQVDDFALTPAQSVAN